MIAAHATQVGFSREPSKDELGLVREIGKFAYDPLGYVNFAFPWGVPGTRLEKEPGPDVWQADILSTLGKALRDGQKADVAAATAIKLAVASGHGIGKTALVAWIILWFASCFEFNQTVVTANTKTQLLTKTWRELAKWHRLAMNRHWFEWTATQFKHVDYPDSWFASAVPWSEHASEAFAGTHEKFVLIIMDEASLIADKIAEVSEGAMTTANAIWLAFGNPTRNTGWFAECFGKMRHRWITRQIDSRTARMANKAQIQQWVDDYGEDSDFVRVRVRGVFPRASANQLIGTQLVADAMTRIPALFEDAAKVMGIDVARHGLAQSVIAKRQGQKVHPMQRYRIDDLMAFADVVKGEIDDFDPDAVFVDVTGLGWGVHDYLRRLLRERADILYAVQVGEAAIEPKKHYNRRTEIWVRMRDFLKGGGALPSFDAQGNRDNELETDLTAPEYGFDNRERYQLEKKEDMEARGLASPDSGDALALTFASSVEPRKREGKSWRDRLKKHRTTDHSAQAA